MSSVNYSFFQSPNLYLCITSEYQKVKTWSLFPWMSMESFIVQEQMPRFKVRERNEHVEFVAETRPYPNLRDRLLLIQPSDIYGALIVPRKVYLFKNQQTIISYITQTMMCLEPPSLLLLPESSKVIWGLNCSDFLVTSHSQCNSVSSTLFPPS